MFTTGVILRQAKHGTPLPMAEGCRYSFKKFAPARECAMRFEAGRKREGLSRPGVRFFYSPAASVYKAAGKADNGGNEQQ